jgi:uncharacterized protein
MHSTPSFGYPRHCPASIEVSSGVREPTVRWCALLRPDALRGVIEAFVTRQGTDYGAQEVPLAIKVCQVHQQLDAGTAVLVYDEATERCTIQPTHQLPDAPGTSSA